MTVVGDVWFGRFSLTERRSIAFMETRLRERTPRELRSSPPSTGIIASKDVSRVGFEVRPLERRFGNRYGQPIG